MNEGGDVMREAVILEKNQSYHFSPLAETYLHVIFNLCSGRFLRCERRQTHVVALYICQRHRSQITPSSKSALGPTPQTHLHALPLQSSPYFLEHQKSW
mmetsp:Transcript_3132/g.12003  ORF Transcript_3132/g.12003 Transcript_3132/m.12003 type:complete len:99 (+) Transcript_3132:4277-4573(+)